MNNSKTSHLGKIFIATFIINFILSLVVLKLFGFEIVVIFIICLAISIITTGLAGIENIIINKTKKDDNL